MNGQDAIRSQYHAALEMLRQTIVKCPDSLWDNPADGNRFWHVAYHALFYIDLYLQNSEKEFTPWSEHREQNQFLGPMPWPPHDLPKIGAPYTKEEVLAYLELCRQQVTEKVATLDLNAEASGFSWLPFGKLELQIYNIRHLQHHTAELMERLGTREGIQVNWVPLSSSA